jgi:SsrA-binding protein
MAAKASSEPHPIAVNRQARHEYHILEVLEAGLELKGSEVKSIRDGGINLKEGYAHVEKGEVFLEGVHIRPYSHTSDQQLNPTRSRKLLLHRKQINRLLVETQQKRLTLIPLKVYFRHGRAKVEIGVAKGKRAYDKREAIRRRESDRDLDRLHRKRSR